MDARTLIIVATLFMLLNGAVLGLIHKSLPADIRPAAADWRIGTLLLAGGGLMLGIQDQLPLVFILPMGNGFMLAGSTLYWRASRRFFGLMTSHLVWLIVVFGLVGVTWFTAIQPSFAGRVAIVTPILAFHLIASALTITSMSEKPLTAGARVLAGIFLLTGAVLLLRALFFLIQPDFATSLIREGALITLFSTTAIAVLPVIGTTAFLVMCQERITKRWETAAATDYLTGLPNRLTITNTGVARFNHAQRLQQANFALAVIDIDHFKSINDRYGHEVGDLGLNT